MSDVANDSVLVRRELETPAQMPDPVRTEEDKCVWTTIFPLLHQIWTSHRDYLHDEFVTGLERLNLTADRIPQLSDLNRGLSEIGWTAAYVDGVVEDRIYHQMCAERVFPVARGIRRMRDLKHSAAPDFVHDVLGHLPMLFSADYRSLNVAWAHKGLTVQPSSLDKAISMALDALTEEHQKENPDPLAIKSKTTLLRSLHDHAGASPSRAARLARFYVWSIEFGITARDGGGFRIGASASLSSPEEFMRIVNGGVKLAPFRKYAITTPVDYTVVQNTMFIADDFAEYQQVLNEL